MKWVSALSTRPSLEAAVQEVVDQAQQELQETAELGLVFISAAFASEYSRLMPLLNDRLSVPVLIGCGGGGIVGVGAGQVQEVEQEPALTLCLAHLPGVQVHSFWIRESELPDLDSPPQTWIDQIGIAPEAQPSFILLADPFSSQVNDLLQGLDFAYPGSAKVGGLASGRSMRGGSGLFFNHRYCEEGTVGCALSGNISLKTIVAQGCRPIGPVFRVIEGEQNIVLQVQEEARSNCATTPLEALQNIIRDLGVKDRELAQHSLFVGVAYSEFQIELEAGDFLIRNLLGVDPRAGAIAIGDRVRSGQRIQFHLRDAQASAEDLELLLQRYKQQNQIETISGALMFSCLGRGERLYNKPNFDSGLFQQYLGEVPLSGFFCNGEIGPIGGSTYLHGYTSVFGVFCEAGEDKS
jgi:small ligand-binding sensory domain FIST